MEKLEFFFCKWYTVGKANLCVTPKIRMRKAPDENGTLIGGLLRQLRRRRTGLGYPVINVMNQSKHLTM